MTWFDGCKIVCDVCGKEESTFWNPVEDNPTHRETVFSDNLKEEGWEYIGEGIHTCPECEEEDLE